MARKSTTAGRGGQTPTETRMMNFAEDLGRILGTAQAKATQWLQQRQDIAKQLTQVRDTAERLLAELTGGGAKLAATVRRARKRSVSAAGKPRRRRMSAEARKRISEAAKKRWAEVKAKRRQDKSS